MRDASQYTHDELQRAEKVAKSYFGKRIGTATSKLVIAAIAKGKPDERIESVLARLSAWNSFRVQAETHGSAAYAKHWAAVLDAAGVTDPAAHEFSACGATPYVLRIPACFIV